MEMALNMGAFEEMNTCEMMKVDGGYNFLCTVPQKGSFSGFKDFVITIVSFGSGAKGLMK